MPSFRSGILSRPGHTPYLPGGRVFVAWRFENSPSDLFFAGTSFTRTGWGRWGSGVTCMSWCMRQGYLERMSELFLCLHSSYFPYSAQPTQAKTVLKLINHLPFLLLYTKYYMPSIFVSELWFSSVQISSISILDMRTWWGRPWRRSGESWIIWTSPLTRPVWRVWSDISEDLTIGLADSRSTLTTQTTGPSCRHCSRKRIKHTLIG